MTLQMMKVTVMVPAELHKQAKLATTMQDTTISNVVRGFLQDYVSNAWEDNPMIKKLLGIQQDIDAGRRTVRPWREAREELRAKRRTKTQQSDQSIQNPQENQDAVGA